MVQGFDLLECFRTSVAMPGISKFFWGFSKFSEIWNNGSRYLSPWMFFYFPLLCPGFRNVGAVNFCFGIWNVAGSSGDKWGRESIFSFPVLKRTKQTFQNSLGNRISFWGLWSDILKNMKNNDYDYADIYILICTCLIFHHQKKIMFVLFSFCWFLLYTLVLQKSYWNLHTIVSH